MRNYIRNYLEKLADENKDSYFICMDAVENEFCPEIIKKYPKRVILTGIQEQNAVNIAIGLALQNKKVFVSITSIFLIRRAVDQLKLASYSNLDINFLALYAGISLVKGGYSHFGNDEYSIISNTPNLEVYNPTNSNEVKKVMEIVKNKKTPKFISLNYCGNLSPVETTDDYSVVYKGLDENLIITTGGAMNSNIYFRSYKKYFTDKNLNPTIINYFNINNFDKKELINLLEQYKNVIFVDYRSKGILDYEIYRLIVENNLKVNFKTFTMPFDRCNLVGDKAHYINTLMGNGNLLNEIGDFFNNNNKNLIKKRVKMKSDIENVKINYKLLGVPCLKVKKSGKKITKKIFGLIPIK